MNEVDSLSVQHLFVSAGTKYDQLKAALIYDLKRMQNLSTGRLFLFFVWTLKWPMNFPKVAKKNKNMHQSTLWAFFAFARVGNSLHRFSGCDRGARLHFHIAYTLLFMQICFGGPPSESQAPLAGFGFWDFKWFLWRKKKSIASTAAAWAIL